MSWFSVKSNSMPRPFERRPRRRVTATGRREPPRVTAGRRQRRRDPAITIRCASLVPS